MKKEFLIYSATFYLMNLINNINSLNLKEHPKFVNPNFNFLNYQAKLFMMKIITLILYLFLIINISYSQWIQQPLGTVGSVPEVEFLNENYGWTCGSGFVKKTTNGGKTWLDVTTPIAGRYFGDLHIVDSNTIYVVGEFEAIIKTTNAGANWIILSNGIVGSSPSHYACFFINSNTGWISGDDDPYVKILKTTNGGLTFDSSFIPEATEVSDIFFKNENEGIVSGFIRTLFRTQDGGKSWIRCSINLPTNYPSFLEMSFINDYTGWIPGGDGRVFKTTNFGKSWDSISKIKIGNNFTRCIEFVNELTGWVGGSGNLLFKSSDGGYNWTREAISLGTFQKITFINDTTGWVCGASGRMYHTTTGGQSVVFIENQSESVFDFELNQNYPNPFNNETIIKFSINNPGVYKFEIFDIMGRLIETLLNKNLKGGYHNVKFNADKLPSGTYFYRLSSINFYETKKFLLVK